MERGAYLKKIRVVVEITKSSLFSIRIFKTRIQATSCTVKLYSSEKMSDGDEWRHSKIVLRADSYMDGYENMEFDAKSSGELNVIGELVAVIG